MVMIVPDFYTKFHCLADRCKDSCCIGWEIDIDEETYAYYASLPGPFGDRLREHMRLADFEEESDEEERQIHSFVLQKKRCPMLDERNLCDIVKNLGEEALCEICTEYPRFTFTYGPFVEKCLSISCEEVTRLLFASTEPLHFEELETSQPVEEAYWEPEEKEYSFAIREIRDGAIRVLEDRRFSLQERVAGLGIYAEMVQNWMNEEHPIPEKGKTIIEQFFAEWEAQVSETNSERQVDWKQFIVPAVSDMELEKQMEARLDLFDHLEVLDASWKKYIREMKKMFRSPEFSYVSEKRRFEDMENWKSERYITYEQLLVYFLFRYGAKSIFDFNFMAKVQMAVICVLFIRDMDLFWYCRQKSDLFGMEQREEIARVFSREVEHSEDNLETLQENFVFDERYSLKNQIFV